MLSLKIKVNHGPAPPADPADPAVTVWYDNDRKVAAYGHTVDRDYWLHFPGVASYCFGPTHREITAVPVPAASEALVRDTYRRGALPMALQALGREVVHASAVLISGGVVAIAAHSTVGKSTLAYGLSGRGHSLWADDAVAFEIDGIGPIAHPLPFQIQLRPASRAYFAAEPVQAGSGTCSQTRLTPAPLASIYVLDRLPPSSSAGPIELRRLSPADGFRAVLAHAYCFDLHDGERTRRMLQEYLRLADRVPIFKLAFEGRLAHVPAIIEHIEGAHDELATRSR